jgi:hypothetical protein
VQRRGARLAATLRFAPSMTNKVGDDHPDDDGGRGGENDTQNSDPHASRGIIKTIKLAQHSPAPQAEDNNLARRLRLAVLCITASLDARFPTRVKPRLQTTSVLGPLSPKSRTHVGRRPRSSSVPKADFARTVLVAITVRSAAPAGPALCGSQRT